MALVGDLQITVFRLTGDRVCAIANHDPWSAANALSRGIGGDVEGQPVMVSPIHKQPFHLASGICIDANSVAVPVIEARLRDGLVEIREPVPLQPSRTPTASE